MPTVIDMQLKATWAVEPKTQFLHGLACALFEGDGAEHCRAGQAVHGMAASPGTRRIRR